MQETWVWFLGQEDPLEKEMATHSSVLGLLWWLSWLRISPQRRRPGFDSWVRKIPWKRERLPTPVFWAGEFHGLYCLWSRKESDTTEWLSLKKKRCSRNGTYCPKEKAYRVGPGRWEMLILALTFPPSALLTLLCLVCFPEPSAHWQGAEYLGLGGRTWKPLQESAGASS